MLPVQRVAIIVASGEAAKSLFFLNIFFHCIEKIWEMMKNKEKNYSFGTYKLTWAVDRKHNYFKGWPQSYFLKAMTAISFPIISIDSIHVYCKNVVYAKNPIIFIIVFSTCYISSSRWWTGSTRRL